ncbi:MAG: type II toxin-antitoxin system VapC family toxin [Chitinophagaceae bacterium]
MSYLLDTNICIYLIKKKPTIVFKRLNEISPGQIGFSVISLAELDYGARKSSYPEKNLNALNQFLIPFEIFEFDYRATAEYGRVRNNLERKGIPIGPLDTLIAAHAKSLNRILVTNNEREFSRVEGLQIENWLK